MPAISDLCLNFRYNHLPYHNAIHAADVLVRVSAIIHADNICDPEDTKDSLLLLSVILAAIVHDYNHPGLTNAFQIATDSAISREFNEQMILENVSLHRSLAAMRQDRFNFLPAMSVTGKRELCSNIIKLVRQLFETRMLIMMPLSTCSILLRIEIEASSDSSYCLYLCLMQVLATDMSRHFELVASFKSKVGFCELLILCLAD